MNHLEKTLNKNFNYELLYNRYKNIALNMFVWDNLPNGIKSRQIEKYLFEYGRAVFYKKDNNFIVLGATSDGNLNIMEEPLGYFANGYGYVEHKTLEEACVCWNNDLASPTADYVREYSRRMNDVNETIKANIIQQKFPFLITTTKNNELSMKTLYKKIENGEPVIYGSKDLDVDTIKVLNTNVPYIVDKLQLYKYELEREILTFLGINNNFEKKERLVTDEVNSNNAYVDINIELMIKSREEFCDEINSKFGLNVSVSKRYDYKLDEEDIKGDMENE